MAIVCFNHLKEVVASLPPSYISDVWISYRLWILVYAVKPWALIAGEIVT